MMRMRSHLLIIGLLFCLSLQSQDVVSFVIEGQVTDKATGEPVENANIVIKDQGVGATTDELGIFTLNIKRLPFTLVFSHVSYESLSRSFNYPPIRMLNIQLKSSVVPLEEVVISSSRIDTLFRDDKYAVLDYEVLDDGILLLIYKARLTSCELLVTDFSGKEKQNLAVLPGKPLALFKDCLQHIHILTNKKIFEVFLQDSSIMLHKGIDKKEFTEAMNGCLFEIGNKLYFEDLAYHNFMKRCYYVRKEDSLRHELTLIADEKKIDMLADNPFDRRFLSESGSKITLGNMRSTEQDLELIDEIRSESNYSRFIKMAYYTKVNAPVFPLGDSVCIFNHPNNRIEIFSHMDSLVGTTPVTYHLKSKKNTLQTVIDAFAPASEWLEEIYMDRKKWKAYTLFQNINGTRDLMEIDLFSGKTEYVLTIPFPYVQKMNIHDGFIYFIYKGWGEGQNKKLFRQKI